MLSYYNEIPVHKLTRAEIKALVWQSIEDNQGYEDLFRCRNYPQILCDELHESQRMVLHPQDMQVIVAEVIKEQLLKMGYKL